MSFSWLVAWKEDHIEIWILLIKMGMAFFEFWAVFRIPGGIMMETKPSAGWKESHPFLLWIWQILLCLLLALCCSSYFSVQCTGSDFPPGARQEAWPRSV
jgi:hypothetical protein